jgi:hypothetical protein
LVEAVMPLPSSALQLLSPADKARGEPSQEKCKCGRDEGEGKLQNPTEETRTWKTRHARPAWIRSASFSALLSEAPWSRNSCHIACSAWASLKWAGGALACSRSCSGTHRGAISSEEGGVVCRMPRHRASILPHH